MGRPPKEEYEKSQIQRIAVKMDTYHRITYHAAKNDVSIMEYIDSKIPKK